jgi:signal transduction histidine kinase
LVIGCALGGIVLATSLTQIYRSTDNKQSEVDAGSLMFKDMEYLAEGTKELLGHCEAAAKSGASLDLEKTKSEVQKLLLISNELNSDRFLRGGNSDIETISNILGNFKKQLEDAQETGHGQDIDELLEIFNDFNKKRVLLSNCLKRVLFDLAGWTLSAGKSLESRQARVRNFAWYGLLIYVVFIGILLQLTWSKVVRPLHNLTYAAERAMQYDEQFLFEESGPYETRQLSKSIREFVGSLEGKVRDRTWKLEKQTRNLQREIREREKIEHIREGLNKKLKAMVERLSGANRELASFAQVAAHDLKTPLRGIGSLAGFLKKDYGDGFDEQGQNMLELIEERTSRMSKHLDSVQRYVEVGLIEDKIEFTNLNKVVEKAISETQVPENIEIRIDGKLPNVFCGKNHMVQVFQNLFENAIRFNDKPNGSIIVGYIERGDFWQFSIADNGPGIEEKYFEKIFGMFQRLGSKDEVNGEGIGLSITKKILELYGGSIRVESSAGHGSTFYFTVPKTAEDFIEAEKSVSSAAF